MELTKDVLECVFQVTREVRAGHISLSEGRAELVKKHGFNPNSATMSIRSLRHMLNGEPYRRALTIDATDYFLTRIREIDGNEPLRTALNGLSKHIDYRSGSGLKVPGLVSVLARHQKYLC